MSSNRVTASIAAAHSRGQLLCDFIDAGMERECNKPAHAHIQVDRDTELLACSECLSEWLRDHGSECISSYVALTGRID